MRTPPQYWSVLSLKRAAIQGHSPLSAGWPPTILVACFISSPQPFLGTGAGGGGGGGGAAVVVTTTTGGAAVGGAVVGATVGAAVGAAVGWKSSGQQTPM